MPEQLAGAGPTVAQVAGECRCNVFQGQSLRQDSRQRSWLLWAGDAPNGEKTREKTIQRRPEPVRRGAATACNRAIAPVVCSSAASLRLILSFIERADRYKCRLGPLACGMRDVSPRVMSHY